MGRVACRFLGGAELNVGPAVVAVDTRKAVAVVAYLAVEGRSSRDTLTGLLWPESDDYRARATLRRTLSALRSALGQGQVVADRNVVSLAPGVACDVAEFREALAATRTHGHPAGDVCPDCIPLLETATRLYRGDFLGGFFLRDAAPFDDWGRTVAEGLRLQAEDALERLAAARAAAGDYRGAVEAARRWIELDPLHEPAHRTLMLLSGWAGDRAGVVEAYRRCVNVLNEELGVAPLDETTELYEAILDDDLPPAPSGRRRVRAEAPTERPPLVEFELIDRRDQLHALERELTWAALGGRVALVTGDAWMGKTRILDEFTRRAAELGNRLLTARGYRAERSLAFGGVVQLLRGAATLGRLQDSWLPDWVVAEVGRLLPEVDAPPFVEGFGETRLFDAVAAVLRDAARGHLLVIAVDDAQWLDPASASFLSYLSHRMGESAILLVLALRTEPDSSAETAAILASFAGRAVELALAPLELDDLRTLVPDEAIARRIIDDTGGVPLLVSEHIAGDPAAPSVRRYVDAGLRPLDGLAAQVVAAASVLAGSCDVGLLRATSGRSEEEVVDAVDDLMRRRILRDVPGGGGLGFTLEATEEAVYERLSPVRRRVLHRRAADALAEQRGADRDARIAALVAGHLAAGGREAEAASWYMTAGDLAAEVYAQREAEEAYRSALAMGHPAFGRIALALGDVLLVGSRFAEAMDAFQAAAAAGDEVTTALAEHRIGDVHRRLGRFDLAEHHFELARDHHPWPAALLADWALLDHRRGRVEDAARIAAEAVHFAEGSDDRRAEARARDILGIVTEDRAQLERALALSADDAALRMAALNSLAHIVARDGDLDGALGFVEEGIELAQRVGDRHRRAALLNHLADIHHRAGREAESQEALTAAVTLFAGLETGVWEPELWLLTRW